MDIYILSEHENPAMEIYLLSVNAGDSFAKRCALEKVKQ